MFHAYESWEDSDHLGPVRALFSQPGLKGYRFIKIPLNINLYHVDAASTLGSNRPQRFIFSDIVDLFEFCDCESYEIFGIHVQSRRDENGAYFIKKVDELLSCANKEGDFANVLRCSDGSMIACDYLTVDEMKVVSWETIWSSPNN